MSCSVMWVNIWYFKQWFPPAVDMPDVLSETSFNVPVWSTHSLIWIVCKVSHRIIDIYSCGRLVFFGVLSKVMPRVSDPSRIEISQVSKDYMHIAISIQGHSWIEGSAMKKRGRESMKEIYYWSLRKGGKSPFPVGKDECFAQCIYEKLI